jgi:uncharacterized membrane protein
MAAATTDIKRLAALFLASGTTHLVRPRVYEPMIPSVLRSRRREIVYAAGAAEILCGLGLLYPRTRTAAGYASAVLLVAIFPGDVQRAVDQGRQAARGRDARSGALLLATVVRLPAQWSMVRTALRAAGRIEPRGASEPGAALGTVGPI